MKLKLLGILGLIASPLVLAQEEVSDFREINPFSTPAAIASSNTTAEIVAPSSLDQFQFNGLMVMNGRVRISIFDAKEKKSFWIREGQLGEYGLSFQRFDEENETVVLAQGGITKKLSLNKVKIEPLRISTPRVAVPTPSSPSSVNRTPSQGSVESDEEARARIQRVAEEIRRRRAERRVQLENRDDGGAN